MDEILKMILHVSPNITFVKNSATTVVLCEQAESSCLSFSSSVLCERGIVPQGERGDDGAEEPIKKVEGAGKAPPVQQQPLLSGADARPTYSFPLRDDGSASGTCARPQVELCPPRPAAWVDCC